MSAPTMILLLLLAIAFIAFVAIPPRANSSAVEPTDDIDLDELTRAENELDELDATTSPEDAADKIPDWGPGVPKR